jgi:hypothetical protein
MPFEPGLAGNARPPEPKTTEFGVSELKMGKFVYNTGIAQNKNAEIAVKMFSLVLFGVND